MFVVSLLFNQIVAWMRGQTGTSSLRAIVYMDEILGYFPPVANPPSKGPLLTLLKQGRAFGVGVVLATQNPVDLDYKGLSNAGTWFLGRLQTERDKARVLEGLEGAAGGLDRAAADRLLSSLGKRIFLLHNVHEAGPTIFQTRWTMSYLRGPLSRDQIRMLTNTAAARPSGTAAAAAPPAVSPAPARHAAVEPAGDPPIIPPGIEQFFVPTGNGPGNTVTYRPVVLGAARVAFTDGKLRVDESRDVLYAAPLTSDPVALDWAQAGRLDVSASALQRSGQEGARFEPVPDAGLKPRNYAAWEKSLSKWVGQSERLELLREPRLKVTARPDEGEREFRIRVQEAQRAARDEALEVLRRKYAPRRAQLEDQLRRAQAAVTRETEQASHAKLQTAVSMGATLLGAILGRRVTTSGTLGRATTAARGVGRSMKESGDIKQAADSLEALQARRRELEEQVAQETARLAAEYEAPPALETVAIAPKRGQVSVQFVALGWIDSNSAPNVPRTSA
jgi:hypothetical protein